MIDADELVNRVNFLNLIPKILFSQLNLHEFYLPDAHVNYYRQMLEVDFNCHIMCYRKFCDPLKMKFELCKLIYPAKLTAEQIRCLATIESLFDDVIFVAYAKPLEWRGYLVNWV